MNPEFKQPINPDHTPPSVTEPTESQLDDSLVAPAESVQPASEQSAPESAVAVETAARPTASETPVADTPAEQDTKKFWTTPKKVAGAVLALVGISAAGVGVGAAMGGKSSPKPVAAHSTSSAPKPTVSPTEQPTTTTPNTPTSSPTSIETSQSGEGYVPHTYKLDAETFAALGWDPQLGEPTHGGAITAHDITTLQDKIAAMNKYGLLAQASSENPKDALKAYQTALQEAYNQNDPAIFATLDWEAGGKYGQDAEQWMAGLISHKEKGLQLQHEFVAPKDIPASGPYMFGNKDFSDVAKAPYYTVTKDGDSWTAQVAVHDVVMLSSPTDFNAGGVFDNDDKVFTMRRIGVTDETGQHSYVWIIETEDSYQVDNGTS